MRRLLFLAVCLALNFSVQGQSIDTTFSNQDNMLEPAPGAQRITLQQAIDTALANNYQLKQADNNLDLASQQIMGAKADFLPSVNGQLSARSTEGQQFNSTTLQLENRTRNSISGSLNASMTIFEGFRNIINLRQTKLNEEYQQASKERTRQTVIFNAASGFLQVVLNQQLLKIAKENLTAANKQLNQVEAQVDVGSVPTVDQYNQESTVASDELTVTQRENDLSYSKTQLIGTLQLDPTKEYYFVAPDLEDFNPLTHSLNLQELIEQALANRHDLKAQKYLIERNEKQIGLSRANVYPSISASAGISTGYYDTYSLPTSNGTTTVSFSDQFFDQQINKFIGISVNIPIFNNLNTRLNVQQSKINYKNSKLDYENLKYSVLQEVRQAYNDYRSYGKQLGSTSKALRAAKKSYETQRERYNVGAGSLIEFSDANAQYVQAQANRAQAVLRFIFQQKLLNYYLGKIDKDISLQ